MSSQSRILRLHTLSESQFSKDILALSLLVVLPFIYFWRVTLGQQVWYTRDILGSYYPYAVEYARALVAGRIPLWTPLIQCGFPLLAEGEVAVFYPTRPLLLTLMPAHFALSYEVLLHLAWMVCGMYLFVRSLGMNIASGLFAGVVFGFAGFTLQSIQQIPILVTLAWLPWLAFFQERLRCSWCKDRVALKWFLLFSGAAGIQWLAGSPQIAVMNAMVLGLSGCVNNWQGNIAPITKTQLKTYFTAVAWTTLPLLIGIGLAAIQIIPTIELIPFSVRSSAVMTTQFRKSYSLPPEFLVQFLLPFAPAEPGDSNLEYWGYVGLMVLGLAAMAMFWGKQVWIRFYTLLALFGLMLALGGATPIYPTLSRLPVLDMFRIPARYLLVFTFALTVLAAWAFSRLSQQLANASPRWTREITAFFIVLSGLVFVLAYTQSSTWWLALWHKLPFALGVVVISILGLALSRRLDWTTFAILVIGVTILDRLAYAAPLLTTIIPTTPSSYVTSMPRSLQSLDIRTYERVLTQGSHWPSVPALRASLSPNTGMPYGIEHAQIASPLAFSAHQAYFSNLSPAWLNLANVRYVLIPLEPRPQSITPILQSDWQLDLESLGRSIPPIRALEITSFTDAATEGWIVAHLILEWQGGERQTLPLRVGFETANWDYGRLSGTFAPPPNVSVAHPFTAFWRALGRFFTGYVYSARWDWETARHLIKVRLEPLSSAHLIIERVSLVDENGTRHSLARLSGTNEFVLAYQSDTVAIWENLDVLPRAFTIHTSQVVQSGIQEELEILPLSQGTYDTAEIINYQPERVEIRATTDQPGYLVLTDSWYPGWEARVNGQPAPIYRANLIFRAVPIEAGTHTITFEYRPRSLVLGASISAMSLLLVLGISFWRLRKIR